MISLRSRLSRTSPKMKRARCFFGTKSCTLAGRSCISSIFQGAKLLAHRAERNKTHAEIASDYSDRLLAHAIPLPRPKIAM